MCTHMYALTHAQQSLIHALLHTMHLYLQKNKHWDRARNSGKGPGEPQDTTHLLRAFSDVYLIICSRSHHTIIFSAPNICLKHTLWQIRAGKPRLHHPRPIVDHNRWRHWLAKFRWRGKATSNEKSIEYLYRKVWKRIEMVGVIYNLKCSCSNSRSFQWWLVCEGDSCCFYVWRECRFVGVRWLLAPTHTHRWDEYRANQLLALARSLSSLSPCPLPVVSFQSAHLSHPLSLQYVPSTLLPSYFQDLPRSSNCFCLL